MAHWNERPEAGWSAFRFNQPFQRGLTRLREEVLAKTDYDPAVLFQWGTMQAMAVVEILKDAEEELGARGQRLVYDALRRVGLDVGRQILAGVELPEQLGEAEFLSFFGSVVNRIAYASLEEPTIESEDRVTFHIRWCPHQDHYKAIDCRVQRYFVQGMMDALREFFERQGREGGWTVRFDYTIPAGAETCHFTIWRASEGETLAWEQVTRQLEHKALQHAVRRKAGRESS
jgi:hypothetical protein